MTLTSSQHAALHVAEQKSSGSNMASHLPPEVPDVANSIATQLLRDVGEAPYVALSHPPSQQGAHDPAACPSSTSAPAPTPAPTPAQPAHSVPNFPAQAGWAAVQQEEGVVVLHVKAGSEYSALMYLLRSVSRHLRLDDLLPDCPAGIAAHRYLLLHEAAGCPNGDAAKMFLRSSQPPGLLVRRIKTPPSVTSRSTTAAGNTGACSMTLHDPAHRGTTQMLFTAHRQLGTRAETTAGAGVQSRTLDSNGNPAPFPDLEADPEPATHVTLTDDLPSEKLHTVPDAHAFIISSTTRMLTHGIPFACVARVTHNQARGWRRQASCSRLAQVPDRVMLVPVAIPAMPAYLQMAAEAIIAFNKRGLTLTPYLNITCLATSAASRIQATFRAHVVRKQLGMRRLLLKARAARVIQRSWRAYLLRMRLIMLSQLSQQSAQLSRLLFGDQLALTVAAYEILHHRAAAPVPVFPEHRLHFGFSGQGRVFQIASPDLPRPGIPAWTGVQQHVLRPAEVAAQHGASVTVRDQAQAIELLQRGTTWKGLDGMDLPKEQGLPQPSAAAKWDDVIIQVQFSSISEAKARVALLLALTWDPKTTSGVALLPPHTTSLARSMPSPAHSSQGGRSSAMAMHSWASAHSLGERPGSVATVLSQSGSAVHSLVSATLIPDWASLPSSPPVLSPAGSRAASPHDSMLRPSQHADAVRHSRPCSPSGIMGVIKVPPRQGRPSSQGRGLPPLPHPALTHSQSVTMTAGEHLNPRSPVHFQSQRPQEPRGPIAAGQGEAGKQHGSAPGQLFEFCPVTAGSDTEQTQYPMDDGTPRYGSGTDATSGSAGAEDKAGQTTQPQSLSARHQPHAEDASGQGAQSPRPRPPSADEAATIARGRLGSAPRSPKSSVCGRGWVGIDHHSSTIGSPRSNVHSSAGGIQGLELTNAAASVSPWHTTSQSGAASADDAPTGSTWRLTPAALEGLADATQGHLEKEATFMTGTDGTDEQQSGNKGSSPITQHTVQQVTVYKQEPNEEQNIAACSAAGIDAPVAVLRPAAAGVKAVAVPIAKATSAAERVVWAGATIFMAAAPTQQPAPLPAPLPRNLTVSRPLPAEVPPDARQQARARKAKHVQQRMLYDGGPASIARNMMQGRTKSAGAKVQPTDGATRQRQCPPAASTLYTVTAAAPPQLVCQHTPELQGYQQNEGHELLTVAPAELQEVYMPEFVGSSNAVQGQLQREEAYARECRVIAARDLEVAAMQDLCATVRAGDPHVWVRTTNTSHNMSPDYFPLSPAQMAQLVSEMQDVYIAAARQQAAAMREAHQTVKNDMEVEKAQLRAALTAANARQQGVIKTMNSVFSDEYQGAARQRVTVVTISRDRGKRAGRERAFAHAFCRQAGLLARRVAHSERASLHAAEREYTAQLTAAHREDRMAREQNIVLNATDIASLNKYKAAAVRATGFTQEMHEYHEVERAYVKDLVALKRLEDNERRVRVGLPGARPAAHTLRQALNIHNVASAVDAERQHQQQQACAAAAAEQQQRMEQRRRRQERKAAKAAVENMNMDHTWADQADVGATVAHELLLDVGLPPLPSSAAAVHQQRLLSGKRSVHQQARGSNARPGSETNRPYSGTSSIFSGTGSQYTTFTDLSCAVRPVSEGSDSLSDSSSDDESSEEQSSASTAAVCAAGSLLPALHLTPQPLPEMPYAKGARLLAPPQSRKPIGILV